MKCFCGQGDWVPREGYEMTARESSGEHLAENSSMIWKNPKGILMEKEIPVPKANEVLIRVGACGICGSDLHAIEMDADGYTLFPSKMKLPVILGHEYSGEVVEVGADVLSVQIGDLIAVEQTLWCGKCTACKMGRFNQCVNLIEDGLSKDGGFTEFEVVDEKFCRKINQLAHKLGSKMDAFEAGALVEPTSVAYNGMFINGGGFQPGGHVVVFGVGAIGLASIALARAAGAATIIAFGTTESRMEIAKQMGADHVFNFREMAKLGFTPAQIIKELTRGVGAAMFIEATGNTNSTYPEIEKCMSVGAKIIQLGFETGKTSLCLSPFMINFAKIYGSVSTAGSDIYPSVIRMMESGIINMRKMVSARFALNNIEEAFEAQKTKQHGKILVSQFYK